MACVHQSFGEKINVEESLPQAKSFQIKIIRKAIATALRYGSATIGNSGIAGTRVVAVLEAIDARLAYLGLDYWVSMEVFADVAVSLGFDRSVGIAIYNIMSWLI